MTQHQIKQVDRFRDLKEGKIRDVPYVDPRNIVVERGHNPRDFSLPENIEHVNNLMNSIREHGVIEPLIVRWDKDEDKGNRAILIDGESRLRAALRLIKEEGLELLVPAMQKSEDIGSPADRLVLALTANTSKPLSVIEAGGAYLTLVKYGWSPEQIAKKVARSLKSVNDALELSGAGDDVKTLVKTGAVSKQLAVQTVRKSGQHAGEKLRVKVAEAKAAGKKTAKVTKRAPKALLSATDRLDRIGTIMAEYSCKNAASLEFKDLAGYLSDINDVLESGAQAAA